MKRKMFGLLVLSFVLLLTLALQAQAQTTSGRIAFSAMLSGPPFPVDFRFNITDGTSILYGPDDESALAVDVATERLHAAVGGDQGHCLTWHSSRS